MAYDPPQQFSIIDHIYELHDKIVEDLASLHSEHEVDLIFYPGIVEAVYFLESHGLEGRLGLSTMDLSKFSRGRGEVETTTISKVANRTQSLLKELEGKVKSETLEAPASLTKTPPQEIQHPTFTDEVLIQPAMWVPIPRRQHGELISQIASLLDEVIYLARSNNLPKEQAALSELERAQLIALLETTLALLKGPLVEKGLLKRVADAALDGATSATSKHTEVALNYALSKLAQGLLKLLSYL
tara:strand:+ start:299 stop:1027 length:729 start_codon:yes stop_codon:yes gene_type:complete